MKKTLIGLSVLFLLAAAGPVRFAVLGDRTGSAQPGVYEAAVAEVARLRPDFVMNVGDMIQGYTEDRAVLAAEWREYDSVVAGLGAPLYRVPGNHDITTDGMLEDFRLHCGEPFYSLDTAGLHIIVLDNSRWESNQGLPAEQLEWLVQDLASSRETRSHTLVFMHKPFWFELAARGKPDTLFALLRAGGVEAVFTGHWHEYFSGVVDGIRCVAIGSSGGGMDPGPTGLGYHYAWVTVDEESLAIAPVRVGSVLPVDEVTTADRLAIERIEQEGIELPRALALREDLSAEGSFRVVVRNPSEDATADDTLRWETTGSWEVAPPAAWVHLVPGDSVELEFAAWCSGRPFPAPEATLALPYRAGRSFAVTAALRASRSARCPAVETAPVIDGAVGEDCWQVPVRTLFAPDGGLVNVDSTAFYFARDGENLYLAAVCSDREPASIVARVAERDGPVHAEDCVGWFLQPDTAAGVVYQVYVSALGTVFDQRITTGPDVAADADWNGEYEVAARRDTTGWSVEVRVPLATLEAGSTAGPWGINFRRKQPRARSAADWQPPIGYAPAGYGRLVFE